MADYLSKPKQWDKLIAICRKKGVIGLDTEFFNVDPGKQSCVGRSRIHVWSIAVRTGKLDRRGYTQCVGWMLPAAALDYGPIRELLEDESVAKEVHNQSVDSHSLRNHGITLRGGRDTLSFVKWKCPWLFNSPGRFKLKALMWALLRKRPVCTFTELVSDEREVQNPYQKKVKESWCSCGVPKCRARKGHLKSTTVKLITAYRTRTEKFKWRLEEIVPGHKRWELLIRYAIEDAVCALQVAEIAEEADDPAVFPYVDSERPKYNQKVTEAIIAMEQVGFARDLEFCTETAKVAIKDEEEVLNWLFHWYVLNGKGPYGPHGRRLKVKVDKTGKEKVVSGVDGIWSSGPKKQALFARKGYPKSPVWARGKVKGDKVKLDHVALKWIADNHPPARLLIEKLLLLGRIRNGKKYLVKLRDAADIVHPVCGGAGDDDERSGAVTGRLGIKGELEAQQLPKPGKKDKYNVRRAIIA